MYFNKFLKIIILPDIHKNSERERERERERKLREAVGDFMRAPQGAQTLVHISEVYIYTYICIYIEREREKHLFIFQI